MPPAYVKPCVKRQKNDMADAEAICAVVARANMRFVPSKTPEQGNWVEPELLTEMSIAKSVEGKVRHPFFKGHVMDAFDPDRGLHGLMRGWGYGRCRS